MPEVNLEKPTRRDLIHVKRMLDAFAQVLGEVMAAGEPRSAAALAKWGVTLWPGPRVGIEYPPSARQILEAELKADKRPHRKKTGKGRKNK